MLHFLWLSAACFLIDQVSKAWIQDLLQLHERIVVWPFFNLTLAYNQGAAFSFLSNQPGWQRWFFVAVTLVISVVLLIWLRRLKSTERLLGVGLSLVLGGAAGNLLDRLLYGHVVDFLDFHWHGWHWPAFNIADSCIFLGVLLLLLDGFRQEK